MFDALSEAIFCWRDHDLKHHVATLPGLLAAMSSDKVLDFPRVRSHQRDAWAMFVAQVAFHALDHAKMDGHPKDEDTWRSLLLALTPCAEAWHLVVDDLDCPALLQPPVPEGTLGKGTKAWKTIQHPDELDILVTSKAHDVKKHLIANDEVELWIYALVMVQTMQGYGGSGYKGITRMNGGYGSRPRVTISTGIGASGQFTRDLKILMASKAEAQKKHGLEGDCRLVWNVPWDGTPASTLGSQNLSPHFIEVCQRIRCLSSGDFFSLHRTTVKSPRCQLLSEKGDVGDPWMPIRRNDASCFTVGERGFSYKRLTDLLCEEDYRFPPALHIRSDDPHQIWLTAGAMARGQGKTEGLHEIRIPLPSTIRKRFGRAEDRAQIGSEAKRRVLRAEVFRTKILFRAMTTLCPKFDLPEGKFASRVDDIFFQELFAFIEDAEGAKPWDDSLLSIALDELKSAIEYLPTADARHFLFIYKAESTFARNAREHAAEAWERHKQRMPVKTT